MVKKRILTVKEKKIIDSLWKGSSKQKAVKSVAGLVRETKLPRRRIMEHLQAEGKATFSAKSLE